jgi:signal transduction histidine kinase
MINPKYIDLPVGIVIVMSSEFIKNGVLYPKGSSLSIPGVAVHGTNKLGRSQRMRTGPSSEVDDSLHIAGASLESILCTSELLTRASRLPDHKVENAALVALTSALADSPQTILQTLAEKLLEVLQADSAGLSLLTKDESRFYWAAIAGAWYPYIGGGTPRDFGPCGDVLDNNRPMLFTHWERRYPYLSTAIPLAEEGLLAPFYVDGKAVGTIWSIAHTPLHKFDAEDLRLLESMSRFASAAYQIAETNEDLKAEIVARKKVEGKLRELTANLEERVRVGTEELEQRNRQLADARLELAQLNRMATAGELSASIAHEVNQPLTGIVTKATAALHWLSGNDDPVVARAKDVLEQIVAAGLHASDIVANVRAMFKKDRMEQSGVDINKMILSVLSLTSIDHQKHGIEIRANLNEHIPPVIGNEIQLKQVILNVVMNAIDSMCSTEIRILSVKSELTGQDRVLVSIADTGRGIESSNVNRIFEPLFTTKPRGMGMGLSICRSIIENHGGRIWADPGAPKGAIFHFEFPTASWR